MGEYLKKISSMVILGLGIWIFGFVICTIGVFGIAIAIPMFLYCAGSYENEHGKNKTAWCYWIVGLAVLLYASYNLAEYFFLEPYEIYMGTVCIALIIVYISYLQDQWFKLSSLERKYNELKKEYDKLIEEKGQ